MADAIVSDPQNPIVPDLSLDDCAMILSGKRARDTEIAINRPIFSMQELRAFNNHASKDAVITVKPREEK